MPVIATGKIERRRIKFVAKCPEAISRNEGIDAKQWDWALYINGSFIHLWLPFVYPEFTKINPNEHLKINAYHPPWLISKDLPGLGRFFHEFIYLFTSSLHNR